MIIYNSTWSILIQWIRAILSGDNLTSKTQKKDPFTSLHKIKENLPLWAELKILRNGAWSWRCTCTVDVESARRVLGVAQVLLMLGLSAVSGKTLFEHHVTAM